MAKTVIRNLRHTDADLNALFAMCAKMRQHLGQPSVHDGVVLARLSSSEPKIHTFVAEADGQVVGYALFYFGYCNVWGTRGVHIDDLFVEESARRRGLGRLLMKEIAKIAIKSSATWMTWVVMRGNDEAKRFYYKLRLPPDPDDHYERDTGIEPVPSPWKGDVLPLYESRRLLRMYNIISKSFKRESLSDIENRRKPPKLLEITGPWVFNVVNFSRIDNALVLEINTLATHIFFFCIKNLAKNTLFDRSI